MTFKTGKRPVPTPAFPKYRRPNMHTAQGHYASAEFWLAVAEQPGRDSQATSGSAAISAAHAALGALALSLASEDPS